ncbi:hypothetical protein ISCGN_024442 [Ixodes scapularis]
MPLRSAANWLPKVYAKCNCPACDKKESSAACLQGRQVRYEINTEKKNLSALMQDIASQGRFVQRLNSRQTSALCGFSVQTFPSLLQLTSTFLRDTFFTYRGPSRKKAHQEKPR